MPRPSARERLMDCAEELFAQRGIDAVSLRAINAEAGLSPAALHYHFQTRDNLVEALLDRRMRPLMARRRELFRRLRAAGPSPSARDVLEVLMRPLVEFMAEDGESGGRYVRFLCRLEADGRINRDFASKRYASALVDVEPLLRAALPGLSKAERRTRLDLAMDFMLRGLADWAGTPGRPEGPRLLLEDFAGVLLDFLTGGLEAGSSNRSTDRLFRIPA